MLKNLIDVQNYTKRLSAASPDLPAGETILRRGGVAKDELTRLADEIGLPPNYRACASEWTLYGVSIGYFELWPGGGPQSDLVTDLRDANLDRERIPGGARSRDFVNVASEEANWICIGSSWSSRPDVVFHIEAMLSPEIRFTEIADGFDKLIILGANLHKISYWDEVNLADGLEAMANCCAAIGCSQSQAAFWLDRISGLID